MDNRFLMNKLAQLEKNFDENLTEEINSLANNNADMWEDFNKKEDDKLMRLREDICGTEDSMQTQSMNLKSLTEYVKRIEADLETKIRESTTALETVLEQEQDKNDPTLIDKLNDVKNDCSRNEIRIQTLEKVIP